MMSAGEPRRTCCRRSWWPPLVREMAKLDDEQQEELCRDLRETPDVDTIKEATSAARWLAKAREAGLAVRGAAA